MEALPLKFTAQRVEKTREDALTRGSGCGGLGRILTRSETKERSRFGC